MLRKCFYYIIGQSLVWNRRFADKRIWFPLGEHLGLLKGGSYEKEVWEKVKQHVPSSINSILDIGANIGQSALIMSELFPNAQIVSYEPSARPYAFLCLNIGLNNLPVVALNKGVSSEEASYRMKYDTITGGRSSSIVLSDEDHVKSEKYMSIEVLSLRSQVEQFKPDFIKIDIEGHEKHLLDNINLSLLSKVTLLIEVRSDTSKNIIERFLQSHKIFNVEEQSIIKSIIKIEFANLLLIPLD